jgi:hypothetical protein
MIEDLAVLVKLFKEEFIIVKIYGICQVVLNDKLLNIILVMIFVSNYGCNYAWVFVLF